MIKHGETKINNNLEPIFGNINLNYSYHLQNSG